MEHNARTQTIALAGVFQAAALVKQWAYHGQVDEPAFLRSIHSLLDLDPADITAVYGDLKDLKLGLVTLIDFFQQKSSQRDKEIASYFVGLLIVQRNLKNNPQMLKKIHDRIPFVSTQIQHFGNNHPTVIANIADIYSSTLSQMKYRIHVQGNRVYLEQEAGINKIRALLLAGVRAALLWQQLGGRLYQLFIFRNRIKTAAQQLLTQINENAHE